MKKGVDMLESKENKFNNENTVTPAKQIQTIIILKIIGAVLLFLALAKMSYGYYTFLRLSIMILSVVFAYDTFKNYSALWGWAFVGIAIIFNPIIPVYFQRSTWNIIDIIAGIIFLASIQRKKSK